MIFFEKKLDTKRIIDIINKRNRVKRYFSLIVGVFIVAFSFNLFFLPNDVVFGGISGLSIIINKELSIEPAIFILICSVLLIIFSYFALGIEKTKGTILGSLLYPLFVKLTAILIDTFDLGTKFAHDDFLLIIILGAVIFAFGSGIIFKAGFSTGGTDILDQIVEKYFNVSLGTSVLIVDGIIVLLGLFFFGPISVMYAMIVLYIWSVLVDRVILGISESKMFYIITDHEEEVRKFVIENLGTGLTIFDAQGGIMHSAKKVLMCVISSRDYFKLREGILSIDEDAFFIVTDSYQVLGGH